MPKLVNIEVYDRLSCSCKAIISNDQLGFSGGKSEHENLAVYEVVLLRALEGREQEDTTYTDFSKAFDRVNYWIPIAKLVALSFRERLMLWIETFLLGRTKTVLM